jgi:hypothetical protein
MSEPVWNPTCFLDLVRRRVANVAIGASTARNMGPKGTVRLVRAALYSDVKLQGLASRPIQFPDYLNQITYSIGDKAGVEWGPARKFVNIYLRDAFYNFYLREEYRLQELESVFELPLDSHVAQQLMEASEGKDQKLRWKNVTRLTPEENKTFQEVADRVAARKKTKRVHLDLKYWRKEVPDSD